MPRREGESQAEYLERKRIRTARKKREEKRARRAEKERLASSTSPSPTGAMSAGSAGSASPTPSDDGGHKTSGSQKSFQDTWKFESAVRDDVCQHLQPDGNGKVWARCDYEPDGKFKTGRPRLRAIFSQSPRRGAEHVPICWHQAMELVGKKSGKAYRVLHDVCHPC